MEHGLAWLWRRLEPSAFLGNLRNSPASSAERTLCGGLEGSSVGHRLLLPPRPSLVAGGKLSTVKRVWREFCFQ